MIILLGITLGLFCNDESKAFEILETKLHDKGPYQIELLSGGLSGSKIYKVSSSLKTYAFRFWNKQWIDFYPQDLAGQLIGSEAGYGPKIYYSDEKDCITVMDYCPHSRPSDDVRLNELGNLLKKIHNGPELPKGIDKAKDFEDSIDELSKLNLPYIDFSLIKKVKDAIYRHREMPFVPCHRDLHPGNISYAKDKFWAFDYTWCGMDDPYFDIATIALFNCVDEKKNRELLTVYLGREPTKRELAKLSLFKQASKMFYGLEFLRLYPSKPSTLPPHPLTNRYLTFGLAGSQFTPDDYTEFAVSFLNEIIEYDNGGELEKNLIELQ